MSTQVSDDVHDWPTKELIFAGADIIADSAKDVREGWVSPEDVFLRILALIEDKLRQSAKGGAK